MTEAAGVEVKTIHRLLESTERTVGSNSTPTNPRLQLLVVDEASMVDVMLMQELVKAIPEHAALLIVGDIDQCPPSDPGRCWRTLLARALCL